MNGFAIALREVSIPNFSKPWYILYLTCLHSTNIFNHTRPINIAQVYKVHISDSTLKGVYARLPKKLREAYDGVML